MSYGNERIGCLCEIKDIYANYPTYYDLAKQMGLTVYKKPKKRHKGAIGLIMGIKKHPIDGNYIYAVMLEDIEILIGYDGIELIK